MDNLEKLEEREFKRSKFLEALKQLIEDEEDERLGGKKGMAVAVIYFCLIDLMPKGRTQLSQKLACTEFAQQMEFLTRQIRPLIRSFSPHVEEERSVIVANLLTWATETIAQDFHGDFLALTQNKRQVFLMLIEHPNPHGL